MTSLNAEPHQLEDDIENEYVDIEAINDEQSNYIQSTAALLSSTGENVNMELASEISATKQQIVNDPLQIFSTSAEHVVSEASNNLDILSIDSNLLQCNPGGSIQKEAVSHITLKRSASFDMATLSLAAMETDNLLCTLNMKPLGDDVSNELKSCMLIQESMEASITSPKNMRDKILQSKDAILEEQSTHNSTSRKGGKKGRRRSGTSCSSGKPASLAGSIWPFLHEQIFLGMAASSVPVRPEAPEVLEDLQSAGIRFVFFSARNMRRSKRVAEKIGLQTDWNCAISLRDMEGDESLDPNRYEWDVKARLPHGVEAIKHHIQAVDNVPLLVSLFTDSTPDTIRQMINVFKEHGEVVLSVGCSYRAHNQEIFNASDVGVSVATLPGEMVIPSRVQDAAGKFPSCSRHSLCQADLLLVFGLIGIGAAPLLQIPFQEPKLAHILNVSSSKDPLLGKNGDSRVVKSYKAYDSKLLHNYVVQKRVYTWSSAGQMSDTDGSQAQNWSRNNTSNPDISLGIEKIETAFRGAPLRLPALLESVRKSRVFLLNAYQVLASLCICLLSLALWPVFAQVLKILFHANTSIFL